MQNGNERLEEKARVSQKGWCDANLFMSNIDEYRVIYKFAYRKVKKMGEWICNFFQISKNFRENCKIN